MKKTVQVKLDDEDIQLTKDLADKNGHTLSSFLRYIVRLFLSENGESISVNNFGVKK